LALHLSNTVPKGKNMSRYEKLLKDFQSAINGTYGKRNPLLGLLSMIFLFISFAYLIMVVSYDVAYTL
jgi:hypothetical protein